MANSFTGINETIIIQDALEAFKVGMAPLGGLSTSYDAEAKAKGDKISVPVASGRTAAARTDGATFEVDTGNTIAVKDVSLDQQYHAPWYLPDGAAGETAVKVWEASARECAYALAKNIFDATLALFRLAHTTGFGNSAYDVITVATASFDLDDVVDLQKLLRDKGSVGPQTLYVTSAGAVSLKKDNQIQNVSAYGSDDVIRTGQFNVPLYGIKAYEISAFYLFILTKSVLVRLRGKFHRELLNNYLNVLKGLGK